VASACFQSSAHEAITAHPTAINSSEGNHNRDPRLCGDDTFDGTLMMQLCTEQERRSVLQCMCQRIYVLAEDDQPFILATSAFAYWSVVALPPRSPVRT
jgi:hypothetical protein